MGPKLENFEILSTIGKGSHGTVKKVKRKKDGKILVWKELQYGTMSETEKHGLVLEVNLLRDLNHPHIVRFMHHIVDKRSATLFIVMEYCSGGDLKKLITRCRQTGTLLEEGFIWKVLQQIGSALKVCHGKELSSGHLVLHRDIKPANIFLDPEGNVKLGDFGLARTLGSDASMASSFVGTPYYMSPEIVSGEEYNEKSDIWSLGCLIYELCALHPPFQASTTKELAKKIQQTRYERIPIYYSNKLWGIIQLLLTHEDFLRPTALMILHHSDVIENTSKIKAESPEDDPFTASTSPNPPHGQSIDSRLTNSSDVESQKSGGEQETEFDIKLNKVSYENELGKESETNELVSQLDRLRFRHCSDDDSKYKTQSIKDIDLKQQSNKDIEFKRQENTEVEFDSNVSQDCNFRRESNDNKCKTQDENTSSENLAIPTQKHDNEISFSVDKHNPRDFTNDKGDDVYPCHYDNVIANDCISDEEIHCLKELNKMKLASSLSPVKEVNEEELFSDLPASAASDQYNNKLETDIYIELSDSIVTDYNHDKKEIYTPDIVEEKWTLNKKDQDINVIPPSRDNSSIGFVCMCQSMTFEEWKVRIAALRKAEVAIKQKQQVIQEREREVSIREKKVAAMEREARNHLIRAQIFLRHSRIKSNVNDLPQRPSSDLDTTVSADIGHDNIITTAAPNPLLLQNPFLELRHKNRISSDGIYSKKSHTIDNPKSRRKRGNIFTLVEDWEYNESRLTSFPKTIDLKTKENDFKDKSSIPAKPVTKTKVKHESLQAKKTNSVQPKRGILSTIQNNCKKITTKSTNNVQNNTKTKYGRTENNPKLNNKTLPQRYKMKTEASKDKENTHNSKHVHRKESEESSKKPRHIQTRHSSRVANTTNRRVTRSQTGNGRIHYL